MWTGSFNLAPQRPNQIWLADITYVPTSEGWLYLAVVLDLFTRKIVGGTTRDHMRTELTIAALTMAIKRQKPPQGLIHHSDRGSQYAAADYRKVLNAARMIQSMSRKGNCFDNAQMESCFGTLKMELVHEHSHLLPPAGLPARPSTPSRRARAPSGGRGCHAALAFQMAEVAIPQNLFGDTLIAELRPPPIAVSA